MMATSLLELLASQQNPQLHTRRALLVLDLQHDFVHAHGKLVVNLLNGFQTSFDELVADFRSQGDVVWVKSEFTQRRPLEPDGLAGGDAVILTGHSAPTGNAGVYDSEDSEDSEDEFLKDALKGRLSMSKASVSSSRNKALLERINARSHYKTGSITEGTSSNNYDLFFTNWEPGFQPLSTIEGSSYAPFARALMKPNDVRLTKSFYSAFSGTNLLTLLRSKLITELYICGSLTNVSVFSTASEAARHGLSITLLEDCLGYRSLPAHSEALRHLVDYCGAQTISSSQLLQDLNESTKHVAVSHHMTHSSTHSQIEENIREGKSDSFKPAKATSVSDDDNGVSTESNVEKGISSKKVAKRQPSPVGPPKIPRNPRKSSPEIPRSRNRERLEAPSRVPTVSSPSNMNGTASKADLEDQVTFDSIDQHRTKRSRPTHQGFLGPNDALGDGDSRIVHDDMFDKNVSRALRPSGAHDLDIFQEVKNEVHWQKMYHVSGEVPRLVCAQGKTSPDGGLPIYRHPADQSLPLLSFSPAVDAIRKYVENTVRHPMNHVLIQLYRGGNDYISEHSDKTLDIVRGSTIVNVSLGAMRKMRLRTKRPPKSERPDQSTSPNEEPQRTKQEIQMPHGSTFVLGLETNMKWLHSINQDRRRAVERSASELAYGGERISLTFRNIGTFLSPNSSRIWGQGAVSKDPARPNRTINGNEAETTRLVHMFGCENQSTDFDWDAIYGPGSDVLHFNGPASPPEVPLLFLSGDNFRDIPVRIYLNELDIPHLTAGVLPYEAGTQYRPQIMFRDNDSKRTQVQGTLEILLYLERYLAPRQAPRSETANATHLLLDAVGSHPVEELIKAPETLLDTLEKALGKVEDGKQGIDEVFLAGPDFGVADAAIFPIVDEIAELNEAWTARVTGRTLEKVEAWHRRMMKRKSINHVVWSDAEG